jgi:hypothetical protein
MRFVNCDVASPMDLGQGSLKTAKSSKWIYDLRMS